MNELKNLEAKGRKTDTVIGHLTNGEVVIPAEIVRQPDAQKILKAIFDNYEININEFTVGNKENKINPQTNQPEFFIKKIFKPVTSVIKSVAKVFGLSPDVPDDTAARTAAQEASAEAARIRKETEQQKRSFSEIEAARRRAGRRGSRMLLSGARVNPEEGVSTLGSVGGQS